MSHPSLQELTQAVHGFAPAPDHVELCGECQETVERLRGERDLLRRADARLPVPLPKRRLGSPVLLALAAAALLAITGIVVLRREPPPAESPAATQEQPEPDKLVHQFLEGTDKESARARELLADSPRSSLAALVAARHLRRTSLRPDALSKFILELKEKLAGPAAGPIFEKLKQVLITIDMKNAPLTDLLAYIAEVSGLSIYSDPQMYASKIDVSLKLADTSLIQLLDLLSSLYSLEFDVRFGVLFVGKPYRMFDLPALGGRPIPVRGHWRKQELSAAGEAILKKLDKLKIDLAFVDTALPDVIAFIRDFSQANIVLQGDFSSANVTLKVKDQTASSALELLLLPRDLDLRLEGKTVLIYERN